MDATGQARSFRWCAGSDDFGTSVAISGDTAVVGGTGPWTTSAPTAIRGAAYVFTRSGATWTQQARLIAADGRAYDWFGSSVALAGDTAVVGAYLGDVGSEYQPGRGLRRSSATGTFWIQTAKLVAPDGAATTASATSVAISGDTAIFGARDDDIDANSAQGSAYVLTPFAPYVDVARHHALNRGTRRALERHRPRG